MLASWLIATLLTESEWPSRVAVQAPDARLQTLGCIHREKAHEACITMSILPILRHSIEQHRP